MSSDYLPVTSIRPTGEPPHKGQRGGWWTPSVVTVADGREFTQSEHFKYQAEAKMFARSAEAVAPERPTSLIVQDGQTIGRQVTYGIGRG